MTLFWLDVDFRDTLYISCCIQGFSQNERAYAAVRFRQEWDVILIRGIVGVKNIEGLICRHYVLECCQSWDLCYTIIYYYAILMFIREQ